MTYLTKSKQNLLHSLNLVDKLQQRAEANQKLFTHHFATVITRLFLETRDNENQMHKFVSNFRQIEAIDEKFDLIRRFIDDLKKEYDAIWANCEEEMVKLGHLCLERLLFSRVYQYVMFPKGEIDQQSDMIFSKCLNELANVITPSHTLIGINEIYHNVKFTYYLCETLFMRVIFTLKFIQECPWIAAQMELKRLNSYKTPQDKLSCIRKCMLTIQNLLAIAKSPVCADDMHPVLIYVIIKANPSTFLSNVQYIEGSFHFFMFNLN